MADQTVTVRISAVINDFTNKMREVEEKLGAASKKMASTGEKFSKVGESFTKVGKAMTLGITTPLATAGALAFKTASDFESSFAGVRKTINASEAEFAALEKSIRKMAKEIPASANEIAGVAEAAGQLGIAKENIMGFTRTMVDLGVATNMTSDEAATQLARLANITGMPQESFDRLGSSIVALGNTMATTEGEIVSMSLRLAAQGSQIGMTEAQITALAGTMSSLGIQAEMGGTAMTTILKKIDKAVGAGGKSMEGFAQAAGVSSEEFTKAWKNDPITALDMFVKGLGKSSKEGENLSGILADLGIKGVYESDVLLRMAGASDLLSDSVKTASGAWEENTALSNEAAERYKTTASQLQILKNKVVDLGISMGQILIPMVMDVLNKLEPWIEKFNSLSDGTKRLIIVISGIAAALGPVVLIVGQFITAIGAIIKVASKAGPVIKGVRIAIGAMTGPIGAVVAAAAALVAAGVAIYKNWDTIKEKAGELWSNLKTGWSDLTTNLSDKMSSIKSFFSQDWETIKSQTAEKVGGMVENVKSKLTDMKDRGLEAIGGFVTSSASKWDDFSTTTGEKLAGMSTVISEKLTGWSESISNWFSTMPGLISEKFNAWSESISAWFESIPPMLVEKLSGWADAMRSWAEEQNAENVRQFTAWGVQISKWFASIPAEIGAKLADWGKTITGWFTSVPRTIVDKLAAWHKTIMEWFSAIPGKLTKKFVEWMTAISKWFVGVPKQILGFLENWWQNMGKWFSEIPDRITKKLAEWWKAMKEWFSSVPQKPEIKNMGKNMIDKVAEGNKEKQPEFMDKLGKIIVDVVKAALLLAGVAIIAVGREIIKRMIEGITNMKATLQNTASTMMTAFTTKIKSIDLATIGKNLIAGLVRGISGMTNKVKQAAQNIANKLPQWMKSVLGIKSPSTVAEKEIGEQFGAGVVRGLDRSGKVVADAAAGLAEKAIPDIGRMSLFPSIDYGGLLRSSGFNFGTLAARLDSDLNGDGYGDNSGDLVLVIDGYELARVQRDHLDGLNGSAYNLRLAAKGG